jgi:cephalosporin hydroxylase
MRLFDIKHLEHMATRFNPLPTHDDFLDNRYQWQMTKNGVEWPYYRFFYHLSKMLQPDLVVELGGWQGTAAAHFAAGHNETSMITIDHHTDLGDDYNAIVVERACNQYDNLVYVKGWSNPEIAKREKGKHRLGDAESALGFIRSVKHTYENAMLDWQYYKPLLASPSLVICDDIQEGEEKGSPISGMMRFWNEMPEPKFLNDNLHPGTQMGFLKI